MGKHALAACVIVLGGSIAAAKDQVVYRVVEDVETGVFPASRDDALADELGEILEARVKETQEQLGDLDGVRQYTGAFTSGQGSRNDRVIKEHGRQRVVPESGGFGGWLARKFGQDTSPEDTLPTFEDHFSGLGRVTSTFIADKNDPKLPKTLNGARIEEAADRVALVLYAEANDKLYESKPIHLKVEELAELVKDPEAALNTPLGELIRSAYRHDLIGVGEGGVDHTGIKPTIAVRGVRGPGKLGPLLTTLPESILDRTGKLSTMTPDAVRSARYKRERNQFLREHMESVFKSAKTEGARSKVEGLLGD